MTLLKQAKARLDKWYAITNRDDIAELITLCSELLPRALRHTVECARNKEMWRSDIPACNCGLAELESRVRELLGIAK